MISSWLTLFPQDRQKLLSGSTSRPQLEQNINMQIIAYFLLHEPYHLFSSRQLG